MTNRFAHCSRAGFCFAVALMSLATSNSFVRAQDWPQWRGPLGQGITSAKNLPPASGKSSLKVVWKTPIPGEGCSSPIVSNGRIFLTTAYEGSQQHPWYTPSGWAGTTFALLTALLALAQTPAMCRAFALRPRLMTLLGAWTVVMIALTGVVLARPTWFWQFADPWTGTTVAPAELPWVETYHIRPIIVFAFGSLALIFVSLTNPRGNPGEALLLMPWIDLLTLVITLTGSVLLGLIAWRPEWFFLASQPWLTWIVTGGISLFAYAGSIGWFTSGRMRLLLAGAGILMAGWLFFATPDDEFGCPLSVQNRITYLVPGVQLLFFHAAACYLRHQAAPTAQSNSSALLFTLTTLLVVIVFVRSNHLKAQTGVVRATMCLDARDGQVLWDTPIFVAPAEKMHSLNSLATPTPACDGERIYAYFGSGLAALDTSGHLIWLKRDAEFPNYIRYGAGSSVALADDKILIYRDSEFMGHGDHLDDNFQSQVGRRDSALIAYDKTTGAEVWKISPDFSHDSYMTPLVWTRNGEREVIVATWKTLAGFALSDGALRWKHPYPMQQIVPSPAVHGDCLFVSGGNKLPCPIVAIRAPGPEALSETFWYNGKTGSSIVSPVCWDGLLFSTNHIGILTCRDAETGQIHWTKRLSARGLASLVAGDGKVYALDQEGTLQVFAADTTGNLLATHSFLENCAATPALTTNMVIVRTATHIYGLGHED